MTLLETDLGSGSIPGAAAARCATFMTWETAFLHVVATDRLTSVRLGHAQRHLQTRVGS